MNNKTIIFTALLLLLLPAIYGWELVNYDRSYKSGYTDLGGRNYLPDMADNLEQVYGIKTVIFRDMRETKYSLEAAAVEYMAALKIPPGEKVILIYASKKQKRAILRLSPALKGVFPKENLRLLQEEVLDSMMGRWYISDIRAITKVLGTFIYMLQKDTYVPEPMVRSLGNYIRYDDRLFKISNAPLVRDALKLFFLEPVSFIVYFPVVMYFLIVKLIGSAFGKNSIYVFNGVWVAVLAGFVALLLNRMNIFYPEYMVIASFALGLLTPMIAFGLLFFGNDIAASAYNYYYSVSRGFALDNAFEGKGYSKYI